MPAAPEPELQGRALRAIQLLTDAMDHMHTSIGQAMELNASDLRALRAMSIKELHGQDVTPLTLSTHLGMSTAATTALIRRLADHGFLAREPHATDRRSHVLTLTDAARERFYQHFGHHLRTMRDVTAEFQPQQLETVIIFLERLAEELADPSSSKPTQPEVPSDPPAGPH